MLPFELRTPQLPSDGLITVCEKNAGVPFHPSKILRASQTPRIVPFCVTALQFGALSQPYRLHVQIHPDVDYSELTERTIKVVFGSNNCDTENGVHSKELHVSGNSLWSQIRIIDIKCILV